MSPCVSGTARRSSNKLPSTDLCPSLRTSRLNSNSWPSKPRRRPTSASSASSSTSMSSVDKASHLVPIPLGRSLSVKPTSIPRIKPISPLDSKSLSSDTPKLKHMLKLKIMHKLKHSLDRSLSRCAPCPDRRVRLGVLTRGWYLIATCLSPEHRTRSSLLRPVPTVSRSTSSRPRQRGSN